jgi:hypothetical protein
MDDLNINKVLQEVKTAFIDIMKSINLDNSNFVKNTEFIYQDGELVLSMPNYADFIDKGRSSNTTPPPINAIRKYIRDKNIRIPEGSTETSLAYAISRSIGKKGIKARPFLERLQIEVQNILELYIFEQINLYMEKTFT